MSLAKFVQGVKSDIPSLSRDELLSKYRNEYSEIFGEKSEDDNDVLFEFTIDSILNNTKQLEKGNCDENTDYINLWSDNYSFRSNNKHVTVNIPFLPPFWFDEKCKSKSETAKLIRETLGEYSTV